jgi:NADP-dependent 3-hydroxy acid dehydrogenase YdfG
MWYFKDKVVVVTGGAQGIGRCIVDEFEKAGLIGKMGTISIASRTL